MCLAFQPCSEGVTSGQACCFPKTHWFASFASVCLHLDLHFAPVASSQNREKSALWARTTTSKWKTNAWIHGCIPVFKPCTALCLFSLININVLIGHASVPGLRYKFEKISSGTTEFEICSPPWPPLKDASMQGCCGLNICVWILKLIPYLHSHIPFEMGMLVRSKTTTTFPQPAKSLYPSQKIEEDNLPEKFPRHELKPKQQHVRSTMGRLWLKTYYRGVWESTFHR